jgi:hypothetical protein
MGKYETVLKDILGIFSSPAWTAENVKTYPDNYVQVNPGTEYIRVSVVPADNGVNLKSVSGVLMIDIFTQTGNGPKQAYTIADKLDTYLQGKTLSTESSAVTQLFGSSLRVIGVDKDNTSLYRHSYSIPFTYFRSS